MAKRKPNYDSIISDWIGSGIQEEVNRNSRAQAAIDAYRPDVESGKISEDQFAALVDQFAKTGKTDTTAIPNWAGMGPQAEAPVVPRRADFSDVSATVDSTESQGPSLYDTLSQFSPAKQMTDAIFGRGFTDATVDAVQSSLAASGYAGMRRLEDTQLGREVINPGVSGLTDILTGGYLDNLEQGRSFTPSQENIDTLKEIRDVNRAPVQAAKERLGSRNWLVRQLGEGVLDSASSASSMASLVGGPLGAVSVVDAYDQAYADAADAGITSDSDKELWAISQAAPELISFLPAERVLEKLPVIGKFMVKPAKKGISTLAEKLVDPAITTAIRTAKTAVGEGLEEGVTGSVQGLAAAVIAGQTEGEKLGQFAEQRDVDTTADLGETFWQNFRAGAISAGAKTPFDFVQSQQEFNRGVTEQGDETLKRGLAEGLAARTTTPTPAQETGATINDFLRMPVPEGAGEGQAGRPVEPFQDFATREAGRMPARQEDLPSDAEDFNRMPVPGQKGVAPARTTPAGAAAQAETARGNRSMKDIRNEMNRQAEEAAAAQTDFDEQLGEEEQVFKERERQRKATEKAQKDAEAKAQKAEEGRRNKLRAQLVKDNPDASVTEIARMMRQRLRAEREGTAAPVTQEVKPAPVTKAPAPKKADAELTDKDMREQLRAAGFTVPNASLEQAGETTPSQTDTEEDFVKKATKVVRDLADKQDQKSVDVQNLIRQGKLVLASNPESVGRTSQTAAAEYVPAEGKMYMYMDRLGDNPIRNVAAALHEATHGGQFNDREGRPSIFRQMMGNEKTAQANRIILSAARNGNKLAQAAVQKAEAAQGRAPDMKGPGGRTVADMELVPYFVTEAVQSRATSFGQLNGVVKDLRAGAKKFLNKIGLNRDLSLNDIDAAAQQVGGELVQTDITPQKGDAVEMVLGPQAAGFEKAKAEGRTYKEVIDQGERFEISDADSKLSADLVLEPLTRGEPVLLDDALQHDKLYAQYPWLADYKVVANPDLPVRVPGAFDEDNKSVQLNPLWISSAVHGRTPEAKTMARNILRSTLLHETQHAIQRREGFVAGANPAEFLPDSVINAKNTAESKLLDIVKRFDLGTAEAQLPPDSKRMFDNEVKAAGIVSRDARAALFLDSGYYADTNDRLARRFGEKTYQDAVRAVTAANLDYRRAENAAYTTYLKDQGEFEARATERRSNMTQEQLDAQPRTDLPTETANLPGGGTVDITSGDTIDTRPLARRRAPASAMEQAAPANTAPDEKISNKEHLTRILAKGRNQETADIKMAEALDTKFRAAMKKDVGVRYDRPEVHKDIINQLTAVENADPAKRPALWKAFSQKYPNIAPVLADMRAEIDRGTDEYIQKLVSTGRELSKQDIKDIQTLMANRGSYLRRAYSAFQGRGVGRKWGENRWANYKKYVDTWLQDPSRVPPQVRQDLEDVSAALSRIEQELTIPDDATLAQMDTDKLENLFDEHTDNVASRLPGDIDQRRDAMIAELSRRRDMIPDSETKALAERAVKELLGLQEGTTTYAKVMGGMSRDPGTLKERQNVPPEIRHLLGQIRDPGGVVMSTLAAQAGLNARMSVYHDLLTTGVGMHVLPPSQINQEGMSKKFPKRLEGSQYGPLQGYYATDRVYAALTDQIQAFYTWQEALASGRANIIGSKALQSVGKAAGFATRWEKLLSVVWNPFNWAGNALGSPLSLIRAGNFYNAKSGLKGMKTAFDYVQGTMFDTTTEGLEDAIRYVNLESVDVAEMQRVLGNKMKDYLAGSADRTEAMSKLQQAMSIAGRGVRRAHRSSLAGYSVLDNWTKLANFYDRVGLLNAYYKAAGVDKTKAEIMQEAGHTTSYTNLSPERVHEVLRKLEQFGATKFVPYFSEVFRTTLTNYNQGISDIRRAAVTENPKAAGLMYWAGVRRLVGNTLATFGVPWAATLGGFMLASGGGDDEEKKRRMVSEFSRYQDLLQFGSSKDGWPIYLPISTRLDPNGPVTDLMRIALNEEDMGVAAEKLSKYVIDNLIVTPTWANTLFVQNMRPDPPPAASGELLPGVKEALEEEFTPSTVNKAMRVVDSWLPSVLKAQADYSRPDFGSNTGAEDAGKAFNWMGARFETMNPAKVLKANRFESKNERDDNRKTFANNVLNASKLTGEKVEEWATQLRAQEFDRMVNDYRNVESLRAWGIPDEKIAGALKDAGWDKEEINQLMSGEMQAVVSVESLNNAFEKRITNTNDSDKRDELKKRQEDVDGFLKENQQHFADMGIMVKDK